MMLAKVFILGQEIELLWVETDYLRNIDKKGKPITEIMGGLITLCFETQQDVDLLLRWMTKERLDNSWEEKDKMEKGEIRFYANGFDYPPTKRWKFSDAFLIYFREVFNASGEEPMQTTLTISAAIQDYGTTFLKRWNVSWIPPEERMPYQAIEAEPESEPQPDLKFIAKFERLSTYKGEFGFDWMRDNYKDICKNYEELKKEYSPTTIHGDEYFVPWLSMFPNQEGVKLKLSIEEKEGTVKEDDIIKLPAKNGIKFVPDEVKVSEANGKEITVLCESALSSDITIDLLDKNEEKVGRLNVFKNDEELVLKVKLVKVKGNEVDNRYNEQTFSDMSDKWVLELFDDLAKKYFSQALIRVEKDFVEEMIINVDKYIDEGVLDAFMFDGKRGIPRYNKGFDQKLYKDFVSKNGEYKGIIIFLSSMHQQGQELGHAFPFPRHINYILMTPAAVGGGGISYGHELGHTLGLHHPWELPTLYETRISKIEKRVDYLEKYLESCKHLPDQTKIKDSDKTLKEVRTRINKELSNLEKEKNDKIELTPLHTFEKATTENIMDYDAKKTPEAKTQYNPHSEGITFWQWQWRMMMQEVKKYHGK